MKKYLAMAAALLLLVGCGTSTSAGTPAPAATAEAAETKTEETKTEDVQTVGEYTIYNATGEAVTELYLYPTGSAKGDNLVTDDHGFLNAHAMTLSYDAGDKAADTSLTLEFVTNSGYTQKFETLHIETAPLTLLAEDAKTGATPIAFQATEAKYTIYNKTGEKVKELYMYATGSSDKGENLIDGAAEPDGQQVIQFDSVPEFMIKADGSISPITLEFTTESGYNASFTTLSYEVCPIQLISEDMVTGATKIKFGIPD
jgi:hypothetical protein